MGLVHQSNAFPQAPFAWNILLAAFPPGRHLHRGPVRTNSGYVSAVALNKPGTLKTGQKWAAPSLSKAGALGNCGINGTAQPQARLRNWKTATKMVGPSLKQRWSIGTLQQKWFAPALNEAAAFENQAKIGCPSLEQGWGIGKLQQKWYTEP